ncbi:AAA family ATPase [Actinomadura miaoliensis]
MRMRKARIRGYRCLHDVEIDFDDVTTLIGPNGVGKSAVLRALDWFFNGGELTDDDVWAGAEKRQVIVEVEFDNLTDLDRAALGKYAAGGAESVRLCKRWEDGNEKLSGRAMCFPPFEGIRSLDKAVARVARYRTLRKELPALGLPAARSWREAEKEMDSWEKAHPERLVATQAASDTYFFGFAGQAKMSGLFDYIFVSVDMRAIEQDPSAEGSILDRIVRQAFDSAQWHQELLELHDFLNKNRERIHNTHYQPQLTMLSQRLTREIEQLTTGRRVQFTSHLPAMPLPLPQVKVAIQDRNASTRIDQQGHGFQRALLIIVLRMLVENHPSPKNRTACLAIEEPELFQHPVQARVFASVLRTLAGQSERGIQVAYATHSPYFLETEGFHQIRRLVRTVNNDAPAVRIHSTTREQISARLSKVLTGEKVQLQIMRVCLRDLPEALFAQAVVLVEGESDKGALEGCAERIDPLNKHGIAVVDVGAKSRIPLAHAILTGLGIPTLAVFDGDARHGDLTQNTKEKRRTDTIELNRKLLGYFGAPVEDFPQTQVGFGFAVFHDDLEAYLRLEWRDWGKAHARLVASGQGFERKHEDTYRQAAVEAESDPPSFLADLVKTAMALALET